MQNRVVVITGGGTGIGRAAALQFARDGAWVVIAGRRAGPLEDVAAASDRVIPVAADLLSGSGIQRVVDAAESRWGRIDVLVNNAGAFAQSALESIDEEAITGLFAMNVVSPSLLSRAALPMLKVSHGSIVNISSTFGHKAAPQISHYAASKAALEQLTRCWALELARFRVRVNAVAPGPTETEILARSGLSAAAIDSVKRAEAEQVPLGRRGTPDEVAAWIVKLADPDATWITGQVVAVDGGLSIT